MPLILDCTCGATLSLDGIAPDTRFRCPKCQARHVVRDVSRTCDVSRLEDHFDPTAIDLADGNPGKPSEPPSEASTVSCPRCGTACAQGDRLCVRCGTLLSTGEKVQAPPPQPVVPKPLLKAPPPLPTRAVAKRVPKRGLRPPGRPPLRPPAGSKASRSLRPPGTG
jgi:DNA-directed RNA polymerase subunit RPC12/RpoP